MKIFKISTLIIFLFSLTLSATDAYIAYSSKDKALKSRIEKALSSLKVKSYNANLLAVADYSGKQKAVGKLERASIVILVGQKVQDIFKGHKFSKKIISVDAATTKVKAKFLVTVLSSGSGTAIDDKGKIQEAASNGSVLISSSKVKLEDIVAQVATLIK